MNPTSRTLILLGIALILAGLIWHFSNGKIPFGKLPGDFSYESENTKIYIPITSGIILSVVLSFIRYLLRK